MNTVMIKLPMLEDDTKKIRPNITTKYLLSDTVSLNNTDVIPIELGGRLVSHPISLNELGKQLLKASAEGDVATLKGLLAKGAPFTADWLGTSPLHCAAQNNHLEVCEILLRAGISKDSRTKVDRTPLHMAAYEGHVEIVQTLLKHGADSDCKDLLNMSPLHWAVQNGHIQVVEALMKEGCNIHSTNKFNLSPIDIAYQTNRTDIIQLLETGVSDPTLAAQNLVIQLQAETGENSNQSLSSSGEVPVEAVLLSEYENDEQSTLQDDGSDTEIQPDDVEIDEIMPKADGNGSYSDSAMKILQEHGISMLPNDESNILTSVMESGHSVVLTDVGKAVLDSVKQSEQITNNKKIITVSADDFLAMTTNGTFNKTNLIKQLKLVPAKNSKGLVVSKNNKSVPLVNLPTTTISSQAVEVPRKTTDMEVVMTELIEARKTIEEYKMKLSKKEQEAERYKQQLRLLMEVIMSATPIGTIGMDETRGNGISNSFGC